MSVQELAGGQCVFSHEESLTDGHSPGKDPSESPIDPEEQLAENTHNRLGGSGYPCSR